MNKSAIKRSSGEDGKQADRRQGIIEAAYDCFLQYGYEKTTLADIATRAGLSRTLLYLQFRNKEEIFLETTRWLYREQFAKARTVLSGGGSPKEKLLLIYEELLLSPWARISQAPGGAQFLEACHTLSPRLDEEYEREAVKLLRPILGEKAVIEVFLLCIDGLYSDDPTTATLRKRIRILVDRFL
jgi:AcrR family transcriptional regulator